MPENSVEYSPFNIQLLTAACAYLSMLVYDMSVKYDNDKEHTKQYHAQNEEWSSQSITNIMNKVLSVNENWKVHKIHKQFIKLNSNPVPKMCGE